MYIYESYIYEAFYDLRCISDEVNNNAHGTEREIAIQAFIDCIDLGDENTEAMTSFLESLGNLNDLDYRDSLDTLREASDFFNEVYENVSRQSKVLEEKREFVRHELKDLLVKIDKDIDGVDYYVDNGEEIVHVHYNNDYGKRTVVTADSLAALARDVLKVIR